MNIFTLDNKSLQISSLVKTHTTLSLTSMVTRKNMIRQLKILSFSLLAPLGLAQAPDYPLAMTLWDNTDQVRLVVGCSPVFKNEKPSSTEIECTLIRTYFFKNEKPGEFEANWRSFTKGKEYKEMFDASGNPTEALRRAFSDCEEHKLVALRFSIGIPIRQKDLKSKLSANELEKLEQFVAKKAHMLPTEKQDFENNALSVLALCRDLSMNNLKEHLKIQHEINSRTCDVETVKSIEKFERIDDQLWVNKHEGRDTCRLITISSFKKPVSAMSDDRWIYEIRRISLNKDAAHMFGTECSKLEETEFYEMRANPVFKGCDYF